MSRVEQAPQTPDVLPMDARVDFFRAQMADIAELNTAAERIAERNKLIEITLGVGSVALNQTVEAPVTVSQNQEQGSLSSVWGGIKERAARYLAPATAALAAGVAAVSLIPSFERNADTATAAGSTTPPPAATAASAAPKSPSTAREKLVDSVEKAGTVNEAVKVIDMDSPLGAVRDILSHPKDFDSLKVSHEGNKENGLKSFDKDMKTQDAAEAWALGIVNSSANSQDFMNGFEGKDGEVARTDTHAERIAKIAKILSAEGTAINGNFRLNNTYDNGHILQSNGELGSKAANFKDVRALQIIPGDKKFHAVQAKIGGGNDGSGFVCLNSERLIVTRTPSGKLKITPAPTPTPTPETPPTTPPKTPPTHPGPKNPGGDKPKTCPEGYEDVNPGPELHCVHKANQQDPNSNQEGRDQGHTEGYPDRGHAEEIDSTQHGDQTSLDTTTNGTEAPGGSPGGGQNGVAEEITNSTTEDNADHDQSVTDDYAGTTGGVNAPDQTEGSAQVSGPAADPGRP